MVLKAKPRSEMNISDCSATQQQSDCNGVRFQEEDLKVDIMECTNPRDEFQEEEEVLCQDSSSSSFGDSMCARDNDWRFGDDEEEAQSMLSKDYPLPETCNGTEFLGLTKKKLTDQWRRFSLPLTWRCKWLELKVKEIESQAREYENEVRNYSDTKLFDLEKSKLESFEGKSIPFRLQTQRMKLFKRGRRKRVEDTTDIAAYSANHNIFSYADKRMPVALKSQYHDLDLGTSCKATRKEDGNEDDCLVSELDCSDDFLAKVLCKIDEAQERTKRLKKRIDQFSWQSHSDLNVQNDKQPAITENQLMPHTSVHNQREVSEQIERQHTEVLIRAQTPPIQISGECLNNKSPGGLRFDTILEDLLMDETEMNYDEIEEDEEKLDYFMKLINEITGSEEADAQEDPTPVTKRRKTSH